MVAKMDNATLWKRESVALWGMSTFRKVSEMIVSYPTTTLTVCQDLEPLLMESTRRFVLFPIQYPDVS